MSYDPRCPCLAWLTRWRTREQILAASREHNKTCKCECHQ